MPSEKVTTKMISGLLTKFEELELDTKVPENFFDDLAQVGREQGRLVLLLSDWEALPAETIEVWFECASEGYADIKARQDYNEDEVFSSFDDIVEGELPW